MLPLLKSLPPVSFYLCCVFFSLLFHSYLPTVPFPLSLFFFLLIPFLLRLLYFLLFHFPLFPVCHIQQPTSPLFLLLLFLQSYIIGSVLFLFFRSVSQFLFRFPVLFPFPSLSQITFSLVTSFLFVLPSNPFSLVSSVSFLLFAD